MIDWLKTNQTIIIFVGVPGIIVLIGILNGIRNKLQQRLKVDKELDDNVPTTPIKNLLQKWNFKKTVTWIFVFLLAWQAFAMIFLFHPSPYDLIVAIRRRNDPGLTAKPGSAVILPATEVLLKSAMMFCKKMDGKEWVLRAEIKKLSEHQLVIYYLYSDENCGKSGAEVGVISCLRPEKNQSYVGVWRDDSRGTAAEIELRPNYANGEICCFSGKARESRDDVKIKVEIKTNPFHSHSRLAISQ